MPDDLRVLFVCTANICRSAYAHVRGRAMLGDDSGVRIDSAGTWGFDASPMDDEMAGQLSGRGIDPSTFRSRRLTPDLVAGADVILTAASEHRAFIVEDWPGAFRKTFTLGQFATGVGQVDPALRGHALIEAVRDSRVPALRAQDVADPYRQGTAAAIECAARLDGLLAATLPRLAGGPNPSPESA